MSKILRYELRRLIWNKVFWGLLIINGIYAWYVLTTDIIAGVSYTAPFSQWSYGAYWASVMPISILTILFLLSVYFSKREKQVEILTSATPVNPIHYALVRCSAAVICFLVICTVIFSISIFFYGSIFEYNNFVPFLLPISIIIVPCFVFSIGAGYLSGRIHQSLLYVLMLVTLVVGFVGLEGNFDFFGRGYFSTYPTNLPVGMDGEPAFVIGRSFLVARIGYLAIGIILLIIGMYSRQQKAKKA